MKLTHSSVNDALTSSRKPLSTSASLLIGIDVYYCQYLWTSSQLIDIYAVELWDSNIDILNTTYQVHKKMYPITVFLMHFYLHILHLRILKSFLSFETYKKLLKLEQSTNSFAFSFQWTKLPISFKAGSQDWGFVPPSKGLDGAPITLRTGDYNLDGFLDMVVVLQSTDSKG